jgi:hypothetical protein
MEHKDIAANNNGICWQVYLKWNLKATDTPKNKSKNTIIKLNCQQC